MLKLREADRLLGEGLSVGQICQRLEVSEATPHRWRGQYGGLKAQDMKRLKALEEKNRRLKRLVAAPRESANFVIATTQPLPSSYVRHSMFIVRFRPPTVSSTFVARPLEFTPKVRPDSLPPRQGPPCPLAC